MNTRRKDGAAFSLAIGIEPWEAVAAEHSLGDGAAKSHHGQTAILEFLQLHLLGLVRVRGQKVQAQTIVPSVLQGDTLVCLGEGREHLNEATEGENLEHGAHLKELTIAGIAHAGGMRIDDAGFVACVGPWDANNLRNDKTNPCHHADASVLEFGLAEPREVLWAPLGNAQGVEVVVKAAEGRLAADEATCEGLLSATGHCCPLAPGTSKRPRSGSGAHRKGSGRDARRRCGRGVGCRRRGRGVARTAGRGRGPCCSERKEGPLRHQEGRCPKGGCRDSCRGSLPRHG
mmetsp:Transcript_119759/g.350210  ORF Transcript_119759/g.350210 Transcript_119759/m.350210 type:complete len:288 (-) Transcript_119759:72-935(-)